MYALNEYVLSFLYEYTPCTYYSISFYIASQAVILVYCYIVHLYNTAEFGHTHRKDLVHQLLVMTKGVEKVMMFSNHSRIQQMMQSPNLVQQIFRKAASKISLKKELIPVNR